MATVEESEAAMHALAERLGGADPEVARRSALDRSVTCQLTDLDVIFGGRLRDGALHDIGRTDRHDGQIRLTMTSDDLLALVDGRLNFAKAWASRRIQVKAGITDLVKLRSLL